MPSIFSRKGQKGKGQDQSHNANGNGVGVDVGIGNSPYGPVSSHDIGPHVASASSLDAPTLPQVPTTANPNANSRTRTPQPPPSLSNASAHDMSRQRSLPIDAARMESPYTEFGRFNPNQHQGHYWNTGAAASTMRTSSSTLRGRPGVGPANTTPRRQKSEAPLGKKRGLDNSGASIVGSPGPSMGGASHWGNGFGAAHGDEHKEAYQYGYTPEGWDVHLDTAKAEELVKACGEEIRARGLDSPLIFSSMALDLSPTNSVSLIRSYVTDGASTSATSVDRPFAPSGAAQGLPAAFAREIRFANPHDLAAVIKWALARMGRVLAVPVPASEPSKKGEVQEETVFVQQRGFLELDTYLAWRDEERRQRYPATSFSTFLQRLDERSASLLSTVFSLLSSTTSYSLRNGMTPSKLSRHLGVLLFGLPEDDVFARTYDAFLRASNATEHLLLAYIRDQASTSALPIRLLEHINGYPSMLSAELSQPGKHARTVPVTQVERTVRLYSADLVQDASELDILGVCEEWEACRGEDERHGKDPQLSDRFRKLLNLRGGVPMGRTAAKLNRSASSASDRPGDEMTAYSSLAEKRWGDFAFEGFSAPDTSKLAFDLRENERKARNRKRETRDWTDFSSQGFTGDDSLQVALDFDDGLKEDMERWPGERAQLLERLRQAQKNLPNFPYDISPRVLTSPSLAGDPSGQRTIHPISNMDEAFADVWADYLLGSGWSNRDELTHRTANFVVLQYKSKPTASSASAQDQGAQANLPTSSAVPRRTEFGETVPPDPRIDAAWFIVQEIVPPQYRAELESAGRSQGKSKPMLRKLNVFKNLRKDKSATSPILDPWGQDVFRPGAGGTTKQIRLGDPALLSSPSEGGRPSNASIQSYHGFQGRRENVPPLPPLPRQFAEENVPVRSSHDSSHSYFRSDGGSGGGLFSTLRAKSRKGRGYKKRGDGFDPPKSPTPPVPPKLPMAAEYSMQTYNSMDFETRSLHEDAAEHGATPTGAGKRRHPLTKHAHGQSKDDAWVDIMFKANEGRLANQDALPSTPMDRRVVSEGMEPSGLVGRETRQKGIPIAPEEDDEVEARAQDVDIPTPPTERDETPPPPLPKSAGLPPEPSETESDFRPVSSGMYPGPSLESRPETPRITREGEQLEYLDSPELRHAELAASSSGHSSQAHGSVHYRPDSALLPPSSEIGLDEERDRERMADREAYSRAESRVPDEIGHGQSLSPSNPASATGAAAASATSGGDSDADGRRNSGSSSSDDDGEPPRIESAQLVRALRASLAPVDTRKAQRDSGLRFGGSASPSSSLTGTPNRPARENPFLKDRTAGRVASLAGKFGGGAPVARSPRSPNGFDKDKALPLSPQTTGNSSVSAGLPVGASAFSTGLSPSASGASAGAGLGAGAGASASVPRRTENVLPPLPLEPVSPTSETRRSIQSGNTSPIYETQLAKASLLLPNAAVAATSSDPSQIAYSVGAGAGSGAGLRDGMPMEPGMETEVRDMEMSTDAGSVLGADEIEIYPDDAASNFSRETRSSQDSFDPDAASKQWPSSSSYANANNTHQFRLGSASGAPGARAGAGVGAGENGSNGNFGFLGEMGGRNSIATSSGASGDEEEMVPMPMTLHQFREPYQPGMPLDNVAEESESVLSGA